MPPSAKTLKALPKADLHSHIDGSVSARRLFEIARRHSRKLLTPSGHELDSVTAFMRFVEGEGYDSLLENVVDRFYPITGLMQSEETIREVAVAYVREQQEDGVAYAEGRFAPQYHTREGLSLGQAIASMASGLSEGSETYGVNTRLIVAIGRESPPALGVDVAKAACESGLAVALDLGGPEVGNPPQKFRDAFALASDSGLKLTVHAGEGAGSPRRNLANMEAAITQLRVNRLGHAIDLASNRRLTDLVREKSITVEMNPISNLVLRKIQSLRDLGISRLLTEGVRVTVNSDDPALWARGRLSDVYASVCESYRFGLKELDRLVENSFDGAFLAEREKDALLEAYRSARRRLPR